MAEVSAALPDAPAPGAGGHCAAIWMRTEAGALVTSSVSLGAAQDHNRLRLIFEAATIESAGAGDHPAAQVWHITPRDPARKKDFRDAEEATMLKPGPHYDRIAGVYSAVAARLDGRSSGDPLENGRQAVALATAIQRSAQTGRAVTLPLPETPDAGDARAGAPR